MSGAGPISVVVAVNDNIERRKLAAVIESESDMKVVGDVSDEADAVSAIQQTRPDVVVTEFSIPAAKTFRAILDAGPRGGVVVLVGEDESDVILDAREPTVSFLSRMAAPDRVVDAIRPVSIGKLYLDPSLTDKLISTFRDPLPSLTPREREVLKLLAEGLTNREIAARLSISEDSVKDSVKTLLSKLRPKPDFTWWSRIWPSSHDEYRQWMIAAAMAFLLATVYLLWLWNGSGR